jgi:hypothetical protein
MFQNASSLKPLGQLKPNCPGMIIRRSSTKLSLLCRSEIQDGHHRQFLFLIGRFLKIFSSETAWSNEMKLGRPSIDASYQVLVHLAKRFQRRRFLEIDQSETRIACGGHTC